MAKRPDSGSDPAHQDETRGIGSEEDEDFNDADDDNEEEEDDEEENEGGF